MTQNERILRHLKDFGKISSMEAFTEYGITRLSARIFDLRKAGNKIEARNKTAENRYGEKTTFAEYSLCE